MTRQAEAPRISVSALEAMMIDPDTPDAAIRPYLQLDAAQSGPFRPEVRIDPRRVLERPEESALALTGLNGIARWRRQERYRRKIGGWRGRRVVSEGDSWFQFPFLVSDVIDWLFDDFAIFSLDAAGDLLGDMVRQDELARAITDHRPHVVLLSGGGNDLLGDGRLRLYLHRFEAGRPAKEYLKPDFDRLLAETIGLYRQIFAFAAGAGVERIVCHSYDRAIPQAGRWLGRPMQSLGIMDGGLQRDIVRAVVDRFHAALVDLAEEPRFRDRAVVADCRGVVGETEWHDELHPNDAGFRRVADRFRDAMA